MSSPDTMSNASQLLTELDAELARIDERLDKRSRQRMAIEKLRAICEPYMHDTPNLTVGEALALESEPRS